MISNRHQYYQIITMTHKRVINLFVNSPSSSFSSSLDDSSSSSSTNNSFRTNNYFSDAPSYKFKNLIRYFHTMDPNIVTHKRSIIFFVTKNFDKISQYDVISILWLLCHLYFSHITSIQTTKILTHKYNSRQTSLTHSNKQGTYLRGGINEIRKRINIHIRT